MAEWHARWSASITPIREQWRRERLRLAGLTGGERILATLALIAIAIACVLVVGSSLGFVLPGRVIQVPGRLLAADAPIAVPAALAVIGCIGMAIGGAAVAAGAAGRGRSGGRLFIVVALALAALGGLLLSTEGAVEFHAGLVVPARPAVLPLMQLTSLFAFIGALVIAVAPFVASRFVRAAAPLLAAVPFLLLAAAIVIAGDATATLSPWVQAQSLDYPSTLDLNATIVPPVLFVISSAAALLALLAIWQASEFSKAAARTVGTALAVSSTRWTGLLAGLLAAKLAWIAAGLLDRLPPVLGGASGLWDEIRSDDAFAWGFATLVVIVALAWLLRDRRRISEDRARSAAGRAVLVFAMASFIVTVLPLAVAATAGADPPARPEIPGDVLVGDCFRTWAPYGASALLSCLGLSLAAWQGVWWFGVVVGALISGLWILRRAPNHGGGVFLTALGVWALPRALDGIGALHPRELSLLDGFPAIDAPQPATLDVIVTIAVAVLAVALWTGRQRRLDSGSLIVILVVSTLLIDGSAVAPSAPGAVLVALALIFPVAYELAFDSGATNRPRTDRAAALLQAVGLRTLALTALAMLLIVDIARLQESLQAQLGFIIFAIPLAATIVASTVRRRIAAARREIAAEPSDPERAGDPGIRSLTLGGSAGIAVVLALAAVGWAFQPGLSGLYPTPAERVAELRARFDALEATIQTSDVTDPATPAALQQRWSDERDWIADHPAPECATPAWQGWQALVSDIRNAGIVIAAYSNPPPAAPQSEIDAVTAALTTVGASLTAHEAGMPGLLDRATADC